MPNFLWSGKTPSGQKDVDEVTAETPAEARKILEGRGWTELRQHTTDVSDFVRRISRNRRQLTPKERLQYRQGTAPGLWANWLKNIENSAVAILALAAILTRAIYNRKFLNHNLWAATSATSAVLLAYLLFRYPVLHWWYRRTKRLFAKLHKARTWHRWDEVLRCLEKIVKAQQATNVGINVYSMARYRALALAGLGRLDEAVTGFRTAAEQAEAPPGLFHTSLASIYTVAQQYDKALESYRAGLEETADKSTVLIEMGMYLVESSIVRKKPGRFWRGLKKCNFRNWHALTCFF